MADKADAVKKEAKEAKVDMDADTEMDAETGEWQR